MMKNISNSSNPLLKVGGGSPDLTSIHTLVLGSSGSGKSILVLMLIYHLWKSNTSSCFVISEMKQEDYVFAEHLPNVFLGLNALSAIDLAFQELEQRKADKTRERVPFYLVVEELTALFEMAGKDKKAYQEKIRVILYTGRSLNIKLLAISQDLLATALGEGSARNQFSLIIALGAMRSSVTKGLFELEEEQEFQTNLPKGQGYLQRFDDGSSIVKIKVKKVRNIELLKQQVLTILERSIATYTEEAVDSGSL